jgi:hypothetical protein
MSIHRKVYTFSADLIMGFIALLSKLLLQSCPPLWGHGGGVRHRDVCLLLFVVPVQIAVTATQSAIARCNATTYTSSLNRGCRSLVHMLLGVHGCCAQSTTRLVVAWANVHWDC